jgi:hypothetical protein
LPVTRYGAPVPGLIASLLVAGVVTSVIGVNPVSGYKTTFLRVLSIYFIPEVIATQWNSVCAVSGVYTFGLTYTVQFRAQNIDFARIIPTSGGLGSVYASVFHPVIVSNCFTSTS